MCTYDLAHIMTYLYNTSNLGEIVDIGFNYAT